MIKVPALLPISYDCQSSFSYIIVILVHLPTELGHVLKWQVKHERKCGLENAPVEKSKARLEINGSVKELLYMYNENECSPTWICLVTLT